jgi:hypothetical protein
VGFREQPNTITLTFDEGDELHGLEVTLKGVTIGEFMAFTGMDGSEGADTGKTIDRFHESLISWNLEDADGTPIPVAESRNRPHRMILRLNNAYVDALTGVHMNDPLPDGSPSGETYPELSSIPTQPLSESLAS